MQYTIRSWTAILMACVCTVPAFGSIIESVLADDGDGARSRCFTESMYWEHVVSHTIEIWIDWGGWSVISSPSHVEAHLLGIEDAYYILNDFCDATPYCYDEHNMYLINAADYDAADLVDRPIAADAIYIHDVVHVHRSLTVDSLYSRKDLANSVELYRSNGPECCLPDKYSSFFYVIGWAISERNVVLERVGPEEMSYVRTSYFNLRFPYVDGRIADGCCYDTYPEHCSRFDEGYSEIEDRRFAAVAFVSFGVIATFDPNSSTPPEEHVMSGVYAVMYDGTIVRLGRFEDAEFDEITVVEGGFELNGSFPLQFSISDPDLVGLREVIVEDVFALFDGDIDRDGELTCADRTAFLVALNSEIEELGYNPRADFNLDGVIDGDDRDAFNDILCFGDFNCDGSVNSTDYIAFLNAWSGSDPSADYSGDGTVNSLDFTLFLNAYNAGCS